ncbi:solute carrier family 34 (sodium-dependent phosphate cotransporter) [Natronoarchaeum philippinense]|uniref:Solute carrier family 34 (Sodium-dependent phosphate cotransporter) n=1 Tax=Natronoarchaeum philippinense TaxID=558529 RepID=A0A285P996_NATPI|nr:hypothetical protein [Natronoarchaeum philippinense]SNZ17817.1 solute carrier family 34 (sodium-dependent phosphate cotransporter) [Natronoarchaeum philippinense]
MTDERVAGYRGRRLATLLLLALAVGSFLFAVQLLSASVRSLVPTIRPLLNDLVIGIAPALGASWLLAYVLLNGSVVAAIALSLFEAELIQSGQLFVLIAGSRLGAAGIVMLIGAADFLNEREGTLQDSIRLGLLTFVVTHTIYVPATVLGFVVLARFQLDVLDAEAIPDTHPGAAAPFDAVTTAIVDELGAAIAVVVALVLFIESLRLLDQVFTAISTDQLRDGLSTTLQYRWLSFVLGVVITAVTTSVAFSLGVLVPLYNRGYIKRKEMLPFVMGASVGTLTDTLLVALVLDAPVGTLIVLLLTGSALVTALAFSLVYETYYAFVEEIQLRLLTSERTFVAFLVLIVVVPIGLLAVPV